MRLDDTVQAELPSRQRSVVERHEFFLDGLSAHIVTENLSIPTLRTFDGHYHIVLVHLHGHLARMESVSESRLAKVASPAVGDISIIPAGSQCTTITQGSVVDFLEFHYPIQSSEATEIPVRLGVRDNFMFEAAKKLSALAARIDDRAVMSRVWLMAIIRAHLAETYFQHILRNVVERTETARRLSDAQSSKLTEYIDRSLHARLTCSQLAALLNMTEPHFVSRFKASFGTTPGKFVLNSRLQDVSRRLRTSDVAVAEIAHATGFSSPSHLCTAFVRRFGMTPSQHRHQARTLDGNAPPASSPTAPCNRLTTLSQSTRAVQLAPC